MQHAAKEAKKASHTVFHITLKVDKNGVITPADRDFLNKMSVGDIARFDISGLDSVTIEVTHKPSKDKHGQNIPKDRLPFKESKIENPDPSKDFVVVHGCKATMKITGIREGGPVACTWSDTGRVEGPTICTKGGDHLCSP